MPHGETATAYLARQVEAGCARYPVAACRSRYADRSNANCC